MSLVKQDGPNVSEIAVQKWKNFSTCRVNKNNRVKDPRGAIACFPKKTWPMALSAQHEKSQCNLFFDFTMCSWPS
jgi:hypothetical protein